MSASFTSVAFSTFFSAVTFSTFTDYFIQLCFYKILPADDFIAFTISVCFRRVFGISFDSIVIIVFINKIFTSPSAAFLASAFSGAEENEQLRVVEEVDGQVPVEVP